MMKRPPLAGLSRLLKNLSYAVYRQHPKMGAERQALDAKNNLRIENHTMLMTPVASGEATANLEEPANKPSKPVRPLMTRALWSSLLWLAVSGLGMMIFHGSLGGQQIGMFHCSFESPSLTQQLTHQQFIMGQAERVHAAVAFMGINILAVWLMLMLVYRKQQQLYANERPVLLHTPAPSEVHPEGFKEQLLANLGHEVRTPVAAVCSYLDLVQRASPEQLPSLINNAKASAKHLMDVTQNILDAAKLQANKLTLEPEEISLRQVILDVSSIVNMMVEKKNIDFYVAIHPETPDSICADSLRIKQILLNLLSNAVKFTHEGFVALQVHGRINNRGQVFINYSVIDSGIGIDGDQVKNLFKSFSQMDGQRTRSYGGTGLGLFITRQLAELMNGSIDYSSRPGGGSIFTAGLPALLTGLGEAVHQPRYADRLLLILTSKTEEFAFLKFSLGPEYQSCALFSSPAELLRYVTSVDTPMDMLVGKCTQALLSALSMIQSDIIRKVGLVSALGQKHEMEELAKVGINNQVIRPGLPQEILQAFSLINTDDTQSGLKQGKQPLQAKRILLVEDTEMLREASASYLQSFGAEVDTAANGAEAVSLALNPARNYDVVLMDIQMPITDGNQACRLIREHLSSEALPIFALTSHTSWHDIKESLDAGMNGHLQKPLQIKEVFKLLDIKDETLDEQTQISTDLGKEILKTNELNVFDHQKGLGHFSDNQMVYNKAVSSYQKHLDTIAESYLSADWTSAEVMKPELHKLKGMSSTVGAVQLANRAAQLMLRYETMIPSTTEVNGFLRCVNETRQQVEAYFINHHQGGVRETFDT